MAGRHAVRAALVAIALALITAHAGTANAAQVTLQPQPAEARTFATTSGGWSSAVDYGGLVCIPGVTCPSATPSYQATGGAGGAGDGFLRDGFATLLGVLSTTTVNWTSPSFVAPANVDSASLSVDVRPQTASLLTIGSVRLRMRVIDVADGTRSTTVADVPLSAASASFTPVAADVPAGALVTGRTYRIELGVALTTNVSAVTSGNVDLDNVVLRITDLEPPSGLTGSFQTTGAPRVDGTVDPLGQDTSVTVEYGTSPAYGSSTSPVLVRGTGAQAFSIPLGSLTPGTRYHYRLVAQNADGTTTTTDQSFVAADPPANTPPVVTGPGNRRDRTVTFARDGDVVRATVEVLDGSRTVVGSYDDADGDGVVTITLPDADASYGVRVVRENADSQSSTSAEVPAVLDRIAPSTGAVGLSVTPALSNDPQRTVAFTPPGDAISAIAQVLDSDGDPVGPAVAAVGGTAIVQLSAGEGDYTVRLTLSDAAGNAATVDSSTVTLDTTGPSGGDAPLVTGEGNRRDRAVTFTRPGDAETAVIELLDADGSVIDTVPVPDGNAGVVRLPARDGRYGVQVTLTDALGNSATTPVASFSLDTSPPDAGPAPTVTGQPDALNVSFRRAPDAASAVIEVLDAGGNVIATVPVASGASSATVGLPGTPGSYGIRVVQTDAAGNSAATPVTAVVRNAPDDRSRDDTRRDDGRRDGGTGGTGGTGSGGTGGTGSGGSGGGGSGTGALPLTDPGRYGSLLRQCFGGDVVLTDVTARGARVAVKGLSRYAPGTAVTIVDLAGRRVGSTSIGSSGRFAVVVRAPASARARLAGGYRAVVGGRRSPVVRLRRANVLTGVVVRGATIQIRGRVDLARLGSLRRIRVFGGAGATACKRSRQLQIVGRVAVDRRTGRYALRVRAPSGSGRLVVRTQAFGSKLASRSSFAVK
jgi:hypothetical protein